MTIDPGQLPHGVNLPSTLAEPDARAIVTALAQHYGWACVVFGRADIEEQLTGNLDRPPGHSPTRHLTHDEWTRTRATAAWKAMPDLAARAIGEAAVITDVIRQAALECLACDAPLTGPPTATWGHCPGCLIRTDLDDLRNRPCPATGAAAAAHDWGATACRACGCPAPSQPTQGTRRLAAVRTAA